MKYIIEGIEKDNYIYFKQIIQTFQRRKDNRKIIIFGAGIMGLQFSYLLEELGEKDYLFCDNDRKKWGGSWGNSKVISPDILYNGKKHYYVFIAMENYAACAEQLKKQSYLEERDFIVLGNESERKTVIDFSKDNNAHTLILGDCTAIVVSLKEKDKVSLKELLYKPGEVKILALNGFSVGAYYHILKMSLARMGNLKQVIVLSGTDIWGDKYHLIPGIQHYRLMKELYDINENYSDVELEEYLEEICRRENAKGIENFMSPDRNNDLSEKQAELKKRNHMKLNWLLPIRENTESIYYLNKMLNLCRREKKALKNVVMPVNYELGRLFFKESFDKLYSANVRTLENCVVQGAGKFIDMSYEVKKEEFISIRSASEGLLYIGRKRLAESIEAEIRKE